MLLESAVFQRVVNSLEKGESVGYQLFLLYLCYRRALLQAWLLHDLNIIPNSYTRENSLWLSGYGIGFSCTRSLVRILPGPCISAMHLFICFFVTDFVCKTCYVFSGPFSQGHQESRLCSKELLLTRTIIFLSAQYTGK